MTTLVEFPAGGSLSGRVAEEVRALMARKRVTQMDLVPVLHVSQAQISARLRGRTDFTLDDIEALARYFAVSPSVLLGEGGNAPRPQGPGGGGWYAIRDSNPEPADMGDSWADLREVA